MAWAGVSLAIGGMMPKASQVSMTRFFGWPQVPVALALGMALIG